MFKIDVWGIGRLGRDIVDVIGKDKIGILVDKNPYKLGKEYEGIEIISPKEYYRKKRKNPIVVTPKGFEKEIISDLELHGVTNVYQYTKEFYVLLYFMFQIEGYRIIEESVIPDNSVMVVGNNLLAMLVKDYIKRIGGILTSEECKIKYYCEPTSQKDGIHLADYLLLGEITYKSELEKFKYIHNGKRCFIVATGPSLRIEDLNKLEKNKEICFSVNTIYKSFEKTKWRPNYYMISDSEVFRENMEYFCVEDGIEKFVSDAACNPQYREKTNANIFHLIRDDDNFCFSTNFPKGSYIGGSVVIDGCLPLAVYMGFKEIYMIGNDCSYIKGATNNHFGVTEKPDMVDHGVDRMLYFYKRIKEWMDTSDVKIYNATRGGALEVFERVNFDDLF